MVHGLGLINGQAKLEELLGPGARRFPLAPLDVAQVTPYPAGSAAELRRQIEAALAWGDLEPTLTPAALELLDRTLAMLWRMTH